jgi:hypothetical protein
MIDGLGKIHMSKVSRIGLVLNAAQPRIVGTAIDGLAIDMCLVARDSSRDGSAVDGYGLCDTVLALTIGRRENREDCMMMMMIVSDERILKMKQQQQLQQSQQK